MPVTKKKETYSEAMARLEKIVSQIDNNDCLLYTSPSPRDCS